MTTITDLLARAKTALNRTSILEAQAQDLAQKLSAERATLASLVHSLEDHANELRRLEQRAS